MDRFMVSLLGDGIGNRVVEARTFMYCSLAKSERDGG